MKNCRKIIYLVDFIHGSEFLEQNTKKNYHSAKLEKTFVSKFNFFWLIIFLPGFIFGILLAFQINFWKIEDE